MTCLAYPVEIVRLKSKFVILCNCVCCSCETFRFDLKGLRVTNSQPFFVVRLEAVEKHQIAQISEKETP